MLLDFIPLTGHFPDLVGSAHCGDGEAGIGVFVRVQGRPLSPGGAEAPAALPLWLKSFQTRSLFHEP